MSHTSSLVSDHKRVSHAHARPLHPVSLAFVPYGIVLVRVRVHHHISAAFAAPLSWETAQLFRPADWHSKCGSHYLIFTAAVRPPLVTGHYFQFQFTVYLPRDRASAFKYSRAGAKVKSAELQCLIPPGIRREQLWCCVVHRQHH